MLLPGLKRIIRSSKWNGIFIVIVAATIAAVFEKVEVEQVIRLAEVLVGLGILGTAFEDGLEKAKGTLQKRFKVVSKPKDGPYIDDGS